jgi:hypothetical protein
LIKNTSRSRGKLFLMGKNTIQIHQCLNVQINATSRRALGDALEAHAILKLGSPVVFGDSGPFLSVDLLGGCLERAGQRSASPCTARRSAAG